MTRDPLLDNSLPASIDAEKVILGAILLSNDLIHQAGELLEVSDFFLDSHRRILESMLNLSGQGMAIDLPTLAADLQARGIFEQIGGATYIASLIEGVPRTDTIEYYARIVKRKSAERETIKHLNYELTRLIDGEEELETIIESVSSKLSRLTERTCQPGTVIGVYLFNDLLGAEFKETEQILYSVHRGEVATFQAITNYGKSTLLLNTILSIAAGEHCHPLAPEVPAPRRVLYIDSESPASRLQADLRIMLRQVRHAQTARENILIGVDALIGNDPLNLSRAEHIKRVAALAKGHRADLVVIDTAASAFELQDENSNAEVTRRVMKPLKQLAREANCAVVFTHHIGKSNETQTGEGAYRGRGASAFGALSRTVFTIERDHKKGPEYIVLHCPKAKGQAFEPVLMRLNHETRWFEICNEKPEPVPLPPTVQEIAEFVNERSEARSTDICDHYKQRAGNRTIEQRIKEAERLGLIYKANQKAPWRFRNGKNGHLGDLDLNPTESAVITFPHFRNAIRDCGNAETRFEARLEGEIEAPAEQESEGEWRA